MPSADRRCAVLRHKCRIGFHPMRAARRPFCSRHSPAVLPDRRLGHPYSAGARPPGRPAGRYCMARWVSDNNGQVVVGAASNISRRSTMKQATDRARGLHASCHILLTILYYSAQRARESRGGVMQARPCSRGAAQPATASLAVLSISGHAD